MENNASIRAIDANALRAAAEKYEYVSEDFLKLIDIQPTLPCNPKNPAHWEKAKFAGSNTPYWRCSACKDACFPVPDGLERVLYCPKCGAHTKGDVEL